MIIKCKMCGGDLNFTEGSTVCECEFCGTQQTVPVLDNEKKMNLFNRANRLRMNAEFDKAATVYASITAEFPEEAEAYWGLCLCKYGIEYVDDPATGNKIPTCHRTLPESIMDDSDFDQACENADPIAKKLYREEAKAIDRLQRDILDIVAKETPYDVFICYKETGEDGARTEDSVLAQDIYDKLTEKGLKVFFARITLEDKLGQQYEPYIYAALHSAKVMLAIGTQYEYFDAVWVKNEWARFLDMMKSDRSKTLIPCYKGIDAYDMPREFKNLQAQDMGKLGWLQDLARGVLKLCGKDLKSYDISATNGVIQQGLQGGNPTASSLLQRAFLFLQDGNFQNGADYAERVLDIEPTSALAYLAKLMAELRVKNREELSRQNESFAGNTNFEKILRFGDEKLSSEVKQYVLNIVERNEINRKKSICFEAKDKIDKANDISEYESIRQELYGIKEYPGVEELLQLCEEKIMETQERDYKYAVALMEKEEWVQASRAFTALNGYKDSEANIKKCREGRMKREYDKAVSYYDNKQWESAIARFTLLGHFLDSQAYVEACKSEIEKEKMLKIKEKEEREKEIEAGKKNVLQVYKDYYEKRRAQFFKMQEEKTHELDSTHGLFAGKKRNALQGEIEKYKSEVKRIQRILQEGGNSIESFENSFSAKDEEAKEILYRVGKTYVKYRLYKEAYLVFSRIRHYRDVNNLINNKELIAAKAQLLIPYKKIGSIIVFGRYKQDNNEKNGGNPIEWIVLDTDGTKSLLISKYALDSKPYNEQSTSITWEKCTLRTWLNGTFINNAFSSEEQKSILTTNVDNSDAQGYSSFYTSGGNNTQDKLFLLSYAEAWKYFKSDSDRTCTATAYANNQGAYKGKDGNCMWWLRSPGGIQTCAVRVLSNGSCRHFNVFNSDVAIRPAFWLNLESLIF